jgi:hypothetical protein
MKKMRTILSIALGITAIGLITSCSSGAEKKAAAKPVKVTHHDSCSAAE